MVSEESSEFLEALLWSAKLNLDVAKNDDVSIRRSLSDRPVKYIDLVEHVYGSLDRCSRKATSINRDYATDTATVIKRELGDKVLFICLGNGGIITGADTQSAFDGLGGDSSLLPVLFSRHKQDMTEPCLTRADVTFMKRKHGEGYELLVIDEDAQTGDTLRAAQLSLLASSGLKAWAIVPSWLRNGKLRYCPSIVSPLESTS